MCGPEQTRIADTVRPRPRLLDLFCGAGGAGMGYHLAGFHVVGVDINPQPRYPFEFIQADAEMFPLEGFDAIHASPPCQAWTAYKRRPHHVGEYPSLIGPMRHRLVAAKVPYVIENVPAAPLWNPIQTLRIELRPRRAPPSPLREQPASPCPALRSLVADAPVSAGYEPQEPAQHRRGWRLPHPAQDPAEGYGDRLDEARRVSARPSRRPTPSGSDGSFWRPSGPRRRQHEGVPAA